MTMLPKGEIILCGGLSGCLRKSSALRRKQVFGRKEEQLGFHSISTEIPLLFVNH